MNSRQRRKHRRAHSEMYWTCEELDKAKQAGEEFSWMFDYLDPKVDNLELFWQNKMKLMPDLIEETRKIRTNQ